MDNEIYKKLLERETPALSYEAVDVLSQSRNRAYKTAMLGAVLHSYNHSLYGFMAPLLVPLFLPKVELATAFILAYGLYPIKALFGPLGALYIGRLGDRYGRKRALRSAMLGMGLVTLSMGLLPTYATIGIAAPLLLAFLRCMVSFFGAAEYNGGAVYCLEHTAYENQGLMSGFYCAASVLGILLASGMCTLIAYLPEVCWRLPFLLSAATAWASFCFRAYASESPEFETSINPEKSSKPLKDIFAQNKRAIVSGLGVSSFFSALYMLPAVFFIAYIPLVTSLSVKRTMLINTIMLLLYMMLLPLGGVLADRWGTRRSMSWAGFVTLILAMPLFWLLHYNTILAIAVAKGIFSILGAWFIGPFHTFLHRLFKPRERYTLASLCYSIGAKGGSAMPALGFLLWQATQCIWAPALLLIFWAVVGVASIFLTQEA